MGRTVIAEEHVANTFKSLCVNHEWILGLIIGQQSQQKDYVCHVIRTPLEEPAEDETTSDDKAASKKEAKKKKTSAPKLEDFSDSLIAQHAKQVTRMLPGGINIIGIFAVYPAETLPPLVLSKLKQVLFAVHKILLKQVHLSNIGVTNEKIVLHVCRTNQRVACKTFEINNIQSSAKIGEFKYHSGSFNWHQFDCRLALDLAIPINVNQAKLSVIKQIQSGLTSYCSAIAESVILIDGYLQSPSALLDASPKKKEGRNKQKDKTPAQTKHESSIFLQPVSNTSSTNITESCGVMMQLIGTLHSRAYVHGKATFGEAQQAVKQDIIRSLLARCEIHCEDLLLIDEEQQDPDVVHEPPRRVFALLPGGEITVSDYLFPGEKPKDSLDAYQELMDLNLSDQDIEFDCERLADSGDLSPLQGNSELGSFSSSEMLLAQGSKPVCNYLVFGLTIAIAVLAASISYLFLRD